MGYQGKCSLGLRVLRFDVVYDDIKTQFITARNRFKSLLRQVQRPNLFFLKIFPNGVSL